SASRAGGRPSGASRARTSRFHSGIFLTRDPPHGFHELGPRLSRLREHAPALRRDLVEPAAPLAGLLDPGALDPPTFFEAIEQRIEGVDVELQLAAGPGVDQL